jgi:hypothetical protein
MGQDTTFTSETVTATTATITNAVMTTQYGGTSGSTGVALTTAGTIAVARVAKVNPGSAVTAVIMASGTQDGQELTIINTAAAAGSSVTFATAGTAAASSHLATDFVISGLTAAKFTWDTGTTLWYPSVN